MIGNSKWLTILFVGVGFLIIGIWCLNWLYLGEQMTIEQLDQLAIDKAGQFGDRFGATTSLFGGLTILGLLYTIILQRKEIADSKIAFTEEIEQLKKQVRIQNYQRFTDTFFQMIDLHYKVVGYQTEIQNSFFEFNTRYEYKIYRVPNEQKLINIYSESAKNYADTYFGRYINNFMEIVKMISKKKTKSAKDKYCNILLAQLTNPEIVFLYYYLNSFRPNEIKDIKSRLTELIKPIIFNRSSGTTPDFTIFK